MDEVSSFIYCQRARDATGQGMVWGKILQGQASLISF